MQLDDVAWDDEQEPLPEVGRCELGTGTVRFDSRKPTVELCGRPATLRGIAYMCDDCHARWVERRREGK